MSHLHHSACRKQCERTADVEQLPLNPRHRQFALLAGSRRSANWIRWRSLASVKQWHVTHPWIMGRVQSIPK